MGGESGGEGGEIAAYGIAVKVVDDKSFPSRSSPFYFLAGTSQFKVENGETVFNTFLEFGFAGCLFFGNVWTAEGPASACTHVNFDIQFFP